VLHSNLPRLNDGERGVLFQVFMKWSREYGVELRARERLKIIVFIVLSVISCSCTWDSIL
jgi:hypothetical protein